MGRSLRKGLMAQIWNRVLFHFFFFWDGGHTKPVWTNLDRPLSFCLSLLSHWDYSLTEKDLPGHLPSLVQWHQPSFQRSQRFIHRQLWHSQVTRNPWVFLHEQEISVTFDFVFTTFAVTISPVCNNTAFWYLYIRFSAHKNNIGTTLIFNLCLKFIGMKFNCKLSLSEDCLVCVAAAAIKPHGD